MTFTVKDKKFRPVRKRSSLSTKLIVGGTVVLALTAILVAHSVTLQKQAEAEQWRVKAQQLEQENQQLEDKIDNLGTLDSIKDIAQDQLGMVDPDTVIITPEN